MNEMALRLLSTEASYVQSVLEETLEEVEDQLNNLKKPVINKMLHLTKR